MARSLLFRLAALAALSSAGCVGPDLLGRGPFFPATLGTGWGYIDQLGLARISFHFTAAGPFSEGLAPVALGPHYGYIDEQGVIVIRPQYKAAGAFRDGLAPVLRGETWTFVTAEGKELPTPPLSGAEEFHEGRAAVRDPSMKWGYVDRSGALVIPAGFDRVEDFSEGLASVHRDGKASYLDAAGHPVLASDSWTSGRKFSEGLAAVQRNGAWGFIDRTGALVIPAQYERAGEFTQGLAPVQSHGNFGFIDRSGALAIEPRFSWAWSFSEGLAAVSDSRGKCGFIDRAGHEVLRPQFDEATAFFQGMARVRIEDQWSYLRPNGVLVWTPVDYADWDLIEEISLDRPSGLGSTSRSTVTFRSDGTAHFQGIGEGIRTGDFEGILEKENFERLAKLLQSQGFFQMREEYPVRIDHPTATLRVTRSGKTSAVRADNAGGPTAWWGMVRAVEGLTQTVTWKKK